MTTYAEARSLIQTGDILLFEGNSLFGRLIKWATKSPYCHVALARWDTGRLMVYQAMEGRGVETVPASSMMAQGVKVVVKRRPAVGGHKWESGYALIAEWSCALDTLGSRYSWASIMGIAWRILLSRLNLKDPLPFEAHRGEYICSEYVAACLSAGGYHVPWDGLGFIAPGDIGTDPGLANVVTIEG